MHERTSRALARLLFVGCCAIPTLLTLITIMVTWTPWYHQRCLRALENKLSAATGLTFAIDDFDRLTPHRMKLHGIRVYHPEIHHPETDSEILRVASLVWQSDGDANVLQVQQPELQAGQIRAAVRLIHDRYLCDPTATAVPLMLTLNGFTIHDHSDALTFKDVDVRVTPQPTAVLVALQATLAGDLSGRKINANATRDRNGTVPVTNWHLSTDTTEIPCSVLSPYIDQLTSLGDEATFSGTMGCETKQGQSRLNLGGSRFSNIDLTHFTQDWPNRLSGYADVNFARCEVSEDRNHYVVGQFESRHGYLQSGLVEPLEKHFGCKFADNTRELNEIPYGLIRFDFMTDGSRLNIGAMCNRDPLHSYLEDDTLICNGEKAIARMPPPTEEATLPATNLAYLLTSPQSPMVPFTPLSETMLNWLLVPDSPAPRDRILGISKLGDDTPPDQVIRMR